MQNVLQWFEGLIVFNFLEVELTRIKKEEIPDLIGRIPDEMRRVQSSIVKQVIKLSRKDRIEVLVKEYHYSLITLLNVLGIKTFELREHQQHLYITNVLINCLKELLAFLEMRYPMYLGREKPVPYFQYEEFLEQFNTARSDLGKQAELYGEDNELLHLVLEELAWFSDYENSKSILQLRQLDYYNLLLSELKTANLKNHLAIHSSLEVLLISLNFNNHRFVRYLTDKYQEELRGKNDYNEMLSHLQQLLHSFNRIFIRPDISFQSGMPGLEQSLGGWLLKQIEHCRNMISLIDSKVDNHPALHVVPPSGKHKIGLKLTGDQISILIRGAFETGIFIARSISAVFKFVVPFLSTPERDELNWDSTRAKSYDAESRDKDVVIGFLYNMIDRIKTL